MKFFVLFLCLAATPQPTVPDPAAAARWPPGYVLADRYPRDPNDGQKRYALVIGKEIHGLRYGDQIVCIGDVDVSHRAHRWECMQHYRPGAVVTLLVRRAWWRYFTHDVVVVVKGPSDTPTASY